MRSNLPLATIILAILLASCAGRPGVTVRIGGEVVPTVLSSTTERMGCSTVHGDAFPQDVPLTTARVPTPVTIQLEAGAGASEIRGWIYDQESPSPSGRPIEEFRVSGRVGTHDARAIVPGRTYQVLVNVRWSFVVTDGEETHVFRLRVEAP